MNGRIHRRPGAFSGAGVNKKSAQSLSKEGVRRAGKDSGQKAGQDSGRRRESRELMRIRDWLKHVRFRRAFFGGVSEADVWDKISELNDMYEAALEAERVRYNTLLKERVPIAARQMAQRYMAGGGQEKAGDGGQER